MKPYPKYMDSGVEWIGEVPEGWKVLPIKRIVETPVTDGPHETPELFDGGIPFISAEAIKDDKIDFNKKRGFISHKDHTRFSKKYKPRKGDVYLIKSGATTGNVAIVQTGEEFNIWSPLAAIRPCLETMVPGFVFFFMKSRSFRQSVELGWSFGTQQNIGMNIIENLPIIVPSLDEQGFIADYLYRKTTKIDELIAKKRRLIQLLWEERAAVINQAVTKGLDPSVKMKDSGVEWIGELPEHWHMVEFSRIINRIEQGWSPVAENRFAANDEWAVIKLNAIGKGKFRETEHKALKVETAPISCLEVKSGDVLLTRANTPDLVGDACIVKEVRDKLMLSDLVYRLSVDSNRVYSAYLVYWLICKTGRVQIEMDAHGTSQSMVKISQEKIKSWRIILPSVHEQIKIAEYLDHKTTQIDQTIAKTEKQIQLLQEYRTALISEVVTGKIDVREEVVV